MATLERRNTTNFKEKWSTAPEKRNIIANKVNAVVLTSSNS
jgi:hypothetical protein